ncbi:MAG TPA: choice-of-anchor tandem repeat GloVer-containing protein, partial [Candidatus Bathyarchaeia archaeon]|nr:choice-of-anchor tandem repeat GloVer-containing protein [Candidatus Bathyarchaeia archaeon]
MPAPFRLAEQARRFVPALVATLGLSFLPSVQAQTLTVLHAFSGQGDGDAPAAGLIMDRGGRLYGMTNDQILPGTVFRLADVRSGWVLYTLHNFSYYDGGGYYPNGKLTFGPDGNLYGVNYSSQQGSCETGCGVVFKLQPPATACAAVSCPWTETVLYSFTGGSDGGNPVGEIAFDSAGNL